VKKTRQNNNLNNPAWAFMARAWVLLLFRLHRPAGEIKQT
jgi:hypothetical protein